MNVSAEQEQLRQVASDRDWDQFHTPKNLTMALAGEVGELMEHFQWLTAEQASEVMQSEQTAAAVRSEIADVLTYLLRLADVLDIDLGQAFQDKLTITERKYPVNLARGTATKYTHLKP